MTYDELITEKAIFELYGASMVSPGVIAHLFETAISAAKPEAKAEADAEDAPKPKRTAKKAD